MKLLIIGSLNGYMAEASKIAITRNVKVMFAENEVKAMQILRQGKNISLIFMDIAMGIRSIIKQMENEKITIPIVACGIGKDADLAVKSIKDGAKEYITLPPDADMIAEIFNSVQNPEMKIIAEDEVMLKILDMAKRVAKSDANILITGESGTGKEVITNFIHKHSKRRENDFVAVNCAAIPENLLESELFGHEKGAFTGAVARRIGKFEEANNGTLFLDEISEMSLTLQAKLLRAIQEKEITRLGGNDAIKVNIRIIATSNRDLLSYVKEGKFREDLYYRLNVIRLEIPALRTRKSDIKPLAEHFLKIYSDINGCDRTKVLSKNSVEAMIKYNWPGNVRELENTIQRAVILCLDDEIRNFGEFIDFQKLSSNSSQKEFDYDYAGKSLAEIEKSVIHKTLESCFGNKTHTANILGISIRTLRNKLQQYEMETDLEQVSNL